MDEFAPGPGIGQGQGGCREQVAQAIQEGGFHEGRLSRSKVLGAVRLKVLWSSTFLVRALTRDSRRRGRGWSFLARWMMSVMWRGPFAAKSMSCTTSILDLRFAPGGAAGRWSARRRERKARS